MQQCHFVFISSDE